jgi:hypothetical protein
MTLVNVRQLSGRRKHIGALASVLGACALVLGSILLFLSAPDVRNAPEYLVMYWMLGLAWIRGCEFLFVYAGMSVRDDVVERTNPAALPALGGALLGAMLCFAAGNVGSGPGWWVVVFSAGLATLGLAGTWLLVESIAHPGESVTIDRDLAAGIRLGGLLLASGLILGRAVAGDWYSMEATVRDFAHFAWAVVPLAGAAMLIETLARPTVERPRPSAALAGALPALIYILFAVALVVTAGWPA